jgi:hypothetical protein
MSTKPLNGSASLMPELSKLIVLRYFWLDWQLHAGREARGAHVLILTEAAAQAVKSVTSAPQ